METDHGSTSSCFIPAAALDAIDRQAQIVLDTYIAPGYALVISNGAGEQVIRNYGYADNEARSPVTDDTVFEIGSIGKSFTAIVLMQLVAEGRVDLQAPLTDYLPWFEIQSEYPPITLHHLLTHTAGITGGHDQLPGAAYEVWALRRAKTFAAPGEQWAYSNVGYKALGVVLETLLQKPYADIIKERIFQPLGMTQSYGAITSSMRPIMARGYAPLHDDRPWQRSHGIVPATWLETDTGDGCIATTASDLALYAAMLLDAAKGNQTPVLTSGQLATMRNPHTGETPVPEYGYGLETYRNDVGFDQFGHAGGMVGYHSQMTIDATNDLTVIVYANGQGGTTDLANFALAATIAALHDEPVPNPAPVVDLSAIEQPAAFAGTWRSGDTKVDIVAGDSSLTLVTGEKRLPLQRYAPHRFQDTFLVSDPDWDAFALEFTRKPRVETDTSGSEQPVVGLYHGSTAFHRDGEAPDNTSSYPSEWDAYVGHYRSYNPWNSNFRVMIRGGRLTLLSSFGEATELIPDGKGFRYGYRGASPSEYIEFDAIVNGKAQLARSDVGEEFARHFVP
jgi:CubicO group peptidase (beta-lactamase class C family)